MALDFDGVSQCVETGHNTTLNEWTIMAWIYAHDVPSTTEQKIISGDNNYDITWGHPSPDYQEAVNVKVGDTWYPQKFGTLTNNTTYHLAGSYGSNSLKAYLNGSYVGANTSMSGPPSSLIGNSCIAALLGHSSWFFDGLIWDARVYNRVLSANEIAEIYHRRGADKVWQGLVGWWRLDEKTSGINSVIDLSGNGNHGTPYNSPVYQASPHRLRRGVLVS